MSLKFLEGVTKLSVTLMIVLLAFSERDLRRCWRTCWLYLRDLASFVPSDIIRGSLLLSTASDNLTACLGAFFLESLAVPQLPVMAGDPNFL